jgi:hypothetical protein
MLQIAVNNAGVYERRVAAKKAAGGARCLPHLLFLNISFDPMIGLSRYIQT